MALRQSLLRMSSLTRVMTSAALSLPLKHQSLLPQACALHSSQRLAKKSFKKGPIYVTMALEQEVQVFDLEGEDLGMMTKTAAEQLAKSHDLHLMLATPNKRTYHPMLKFCTAEELRTEEKRVKAEKKSKQKEKRLNINTKIMEHDLNIKVMHVVKLLQKDCRVVVRIQNSVPGKEKQIVPLYQHFSEACKGFSTISQINKTNHEMMFLLKPHHHHQAKSHAPPVMKNEDLKRKRK